MDKRIRLNLLYDYYKDFFTEKQQSYFEDYYYSNYSLGEIAEANDVSRNAIHNQLKIVEEKLGMGAMDVFTKALENVMPVLEVKARRVGGSTYQVPLEIRADRRQTLGIRWLVLYSRKRSERTMDAALAGEIMDAYNNTGASVKKREETHRMAEANKAFAHFRW